MERNLPKDDLMKYLQDTYQFFKNEVDPPEDVNPFQMLQRRSKLSKELLSRCEDIIKSLCLDNGNVHSDIRDDMEPKTDLEGIYVEMGGDTSEVTCNPSVVSLLSDLNHYLAMKPVAPKSLGGTTTKCELKASPSSAPVPFSYFNFPAKRKDSNKSSERGSNTETATQGAKPTYSKKLTDCPFATLPASQLSNQPVTHKGSLTKIEKRLLFEQWKKIFCAIVDKWFLGYANESASAPVIILYLAELEILPSADNKRFQIHNVANGKRFMLQAESDAERTEWLKRIQNVPLNPLEVTSNHLIVLATINSPARSSVKGLVQRRKSVSALKCEQHTTTTVNTLLDTIPAALDLRREHEYEIIGPSSRTNHETEKNRCM